MGQLQSEQWVNYIGLSIPGALLEKVRKNTLYEGMEQERNYIRIGKVLERFSGAGIPVIVLKGLALRELYPHPGLRTMNDADLLVKPGDMESAGKVLEEAGYKMYLNIGKHAEYSHAFFSGVVELHRSMAPDGGFEKIIDFEDSVWERAVPVNISGTRVLSLYPQDKVLYLSIHMASHIISSGFGLRQLCDFVLFIETYGSKIDWEEFFKLAELYHIETFVKVVLEGCHVLFDLALPEICRKYELQDLLLVKSFIEDVFDGGVYGKKTNERITANRLLYYTGGIEASSLMKKLQGFLNLLFPRAEKLDVRFDYAGKYHLLLPVAWLHRIFYCFVRKDIDFAEKTSVLTSGVPVGICNSRSALLRKLGLLD